MKEVDFIMLLLLFIIITSTTPIHGSITGSDLSPLPETSFVILPDDRAPPSHFDESSPPTNTQSPATPLEGSLDSTLGIPPIPENNEGPVVSIPLNPPLTFPIENSAPPPLLPIEDSAPPPMFPIQDSAPPPMFPIQDSAPPSMLPIQNSASPPMVPIQNSPTPTTSLPVQNSPPPLTLPIQDSAPPPMLSSQNSAPPPMFPIQNSAPPPMFPIQNSAPPPMLSSENSAPPPMLLTQDSSPPPMFPIQDSVPPPMFPIKYSAPPPLLPIQNSAPPPMPPMPNSSPPLTSQAQNQAPPPMPIKELPPPTPPTSSSHTPDTPFVTPVSAPPPRVGQTSYKVPVKTPAPQEPMRPNNAHKRLHVPASSPVNYANKKPRMSAPEPTAYLPPPSGGQGFLISPAASEPPTVLPERNRPRHRLHIPKKKGPADFPSSPSPSPTPPSISTISTGGAKRAFGPKSKPHFPTPVLALPPPPPNEDCTSVSCTEPFVNTPPGAFCGCVWPMQVGLRFKVALITFFPLVTELAEQVAAGVFMQQSQVRIMGANADGQQLDKTIVHVDLAPFGEKFDNATAHFTYEQFWKKRVFLKTSIFGDHEVLYVEYPGLPPSPPSAPSMLNGGLNSVHGNHGRTMHPLAVNIQMRKKGGIGGNMISITVLSSVIVIGLCMGVAWLLLRKQGDNSGLVPPSKSSGMDKAMILGGGLSSTSCSSIGTYTGSAKTFSIGEILKATNNFDASKILGEGGFGLVYYGILDEGAKVAVKVLKRNDLQGGREFLAEVEMLSRLHHRNLVKLIGICTEERSRCLVYELIPNGSVDSHLHGVEKKIMPLDWSSRLKIALGSARGLSYLHEDSNPRVIHRDFKSSNILLENDFTPKVSDFGLARTALDDGNKHISTHIMGTFGYVAPEYAMTGHLLVKSDVYSYGVVLLELLTGRKPVDMSRPQGQENLVTWARPLLNNSDSLEMIIDPSIGSVSFDSVAKVAAIASMCIQPEVSNRPFMGEVVQALKLVCSECDENNVVVSESSSQEDLTLLRNDTRTSTGSDLPPEPSLRADYRMIDYDFDSSQEMTRPLSVSDIFTSSPGFDKSSLESFRRHSSSGPLRTARSSQFWDRVRGIPAGSMSEHRFAFRLWAGPR
ncbi:receptor-like serine/threonine-protein kinase ALE2 isoform X2 [Papaver somniferum]|uniref:receptor-like serine/threonine-protein kinase ALE2 isoform X2 n=1 Tax=Papaver somniferum TaxID=3469 RepID=UPI000E6F98F0|nr:receptor-like serine/threonine-protein kinase ALE2 isoform X2 [Papaver somniferum]